MRYWWVNDYMDCDKDYLNFGYNNIGRAKHYGALSGEKGDLFIKYHSTNKSNEFDYNIPKKTIYAIGEIVDSPEQIVLDPKGNFHRDISVEYLSSKIFVDSGFIEQVDLLQSNFLFTGKRFIKQKTKKDNIYSPPIDFFSELSPKAFQYILDNIPKENDISKYIEKIEGIKSHQPPSVKTNIEFSKSKDAFLKSINSDNDDIYTLDKTKQKKATKKHEEIVGYIYDYFTKKGIDVFDHKGDYKDYDLVIQNNDNYFLFEVKSINGDSLNNQIKKALGQILIYKHELEKHGNIVNPFLAINDVDLDYSKFKDIFDKYGIKIFECPRELKKIDEFLNQ